MVCDDKFCENTKLKLNKAFAEMDKDFEEIAEELGETEDE
jgi:hypothetical protein